MPNSTLIDTTFLKTSEIRTCHCLHKTGRLLEVLDLKIKYICIFTLDRDKKIVVTPFGPESSPSFNTTMMRDLRID